MKLKNNLLIICNNFPNITNTHIGSIFVKDQLLYLSRYFKKIYVLVLSPFSISKIRGTPTEDYTFGNIDVYFVKYVDFPPTYFFLRDLWARREKNAVLKFLHNHNIEFDLIHAHNTWRAGRVSVELKKLFDVPVIITEHTSNVLYRAIGKKDTQFIKTWKLSDAIIRVNKKDCNLFKGLGVPQEKIYAIPNGFDHDLFFPIDKEKAKAKLESSFNKKIILSVGALLPTKGYPYMLEAIKDIIKIRKDILYIIVGDGKLKNKLENQINKLGLKDYVKLVGGRPHDEIPIWMNACDVFVLPSLNEGNPTVMFEALGCGKPFVGTKVGGVPEIITSEDYGLLCEPATPKALAEKILTALDKEWDNEKIREYAEQFRWENIAEEIMDVYTQVLG